MICEKCNKNIDDDSKFCSFCGNKIEKKVEEVYIDKLKQNISDEIELSKNEELKDSGEDEKNLKSMGFYDFYFKYIFDTIAKAFWISLTNIHGISTLYFVSEIYAIAPLTIASFKYSRSKHFCSSIF